MAEVMVKLNDSFSGEGNSVLRIDDQLADAIKDDRCAGHEVKPPKV